MNAGYALMVSFQKPQAISVAGREVANIQGRLEIGRIGEAFFDACFRAERVGVRQIVMVMETAEHTMFPRERSQTMRHFQSERPDAALGAQSFGRLKNGIDLRVAITLVKVHVVRKYRDARIVELPLDLGVVVRGRVHAPIPQLLARLLTAHARSV